METNFEHYKDEILIETLYNSSSTCDFKRKHILNTDDCRTISCEDCKQRIKEWFKKEYQPEPKVEIDWPKVPKDTLVYVANALNEDRTLKRKKIRHFCNYTGESFLTYNDGYSSNEMQNTISWNYCELVLPEDVEKYKK